MSNLIKSYSNIFSPPFCKEVRSYIKSNNWIFSQKNELVDWQETIASDLNSLIQEFLSFSRESHINKYFLHSMSLIQSHNIDNSLRKNDEIKYIKGERIFRNFKILVNLDETDSDELFFPIQGDLILAKEGSVVIFPTSYMFPYKVISPSTLKIQLNYALDAERVLNPVKEDLDVY